MTLVCAVDGVEVAKSRSGAMVHVEAVPSKVDPDHEVTAVERAEFMAVVDAESDLVSAVEDMLVHHATLHPSDGCEWAARLAAAVRSA